MRSSRRGPRTAGRAAVASRHGGWWLAAIGLASLAGCIPWTPFVPTPRPGEDPYNQITTVCFQGTGLSRAVGSLPPSAFWLRLPKGSLLDTIHVIRAYYIPRRIPKGDPVEDGKALLQQYSSRIHPLLTDWIADSSASTRKVLLVTFRDHLRLPRFPDLPPGATPGSVTYRAATDQADSLVAGVKSQRALRYTADSLEITQIDSARVLDRYWVIQALLVRMPIGRVLPLLGRRDDIMYIAPDSSGEAPPSCQTDVRNYCQSHPGDCTCDALDDSYTDRPADAAESMDADVWAGLPGTIGPMSLLDTGVRKSHVAFAAPTGTTSPLGVLGDCVTGNANCVGGDPLDMCDGHGTSSAAILVGLPCPTDRYRGLTRGVLDCFKVYSRPVDCDTDDPGLYRPAVLKAFEASLPKFDRLFIAEMQAYGGDFSDICSAANNAFDAGAATIAAQGNDCYSGETVRAPAAARYAIGVGTYDLEDRDCTDQAKCPGPAGDGRIKPDVLGPTSTFTAINASADYCGKDDYAFDSYPNTSGATPYVASAAALLRKVLSASPGAARDPGQIYSALILSGNLPWTPSGTGSDCVSNTGYSYAGFDPWRGAGRIELPTSGCLSFGKIALASNVVVDIPVSMNGAGRLDAALWWPDRQIAMTPCFETRTLTIETPAYYGWGNFVWERKTFTFRVPVPCPSVDAHSDVDLELWAPGASGPAASSYDQPGVFEKAAATVSPSTGGTWTLRVIGKFIPGGGAGWQTIYWAAVARP